ncbi:MAG: PspA/IM30 family protein [Planctomycetaceae bacterium]
MPVFSRLTDIVTCNLSSILAAADDPRTVLAEVIFEMEQGIAGAQRSMKTAADNEGRIRTEIDELRRQTVYWTDKAREHLAASDEQQARLDLMRKHEVENLIAGLEIQLKAATSTREHLTTTYHALESRLADARRRMATIESPSGVAGDEVRSSTSVTAFSEARPATQDIDIELAALRKELEGG